ncbi:MAG: hypothetical protein AVO35_08905 [Candidatus Aegiribacteria sp. MLS_C]|nr:MAG: hypothetical protein AVO35_08905 [Candidatus Aegiribacteria sp. MLS_C]
MNPQAPSIPLSVIIVNYNCGSQLLDCLDSLYRTVTVSPMEVIVVDNGSKDGSVQLARTSFPAARFIENDFNNWFTGATNQGIQESSGRYLLCLNPDTVCHPDAVDSMVGFMESHPEAGIVGPRLVNGDGTLQPSCRKFLRSRYLVLKHLLPWKLLPNSWKRRVVLEYWDHGSTIESDWLIGACILARREAVDDVGLKDEAFPLFHEETDWCYRMRERGWKVWFLHTAGITHLGSQSVSRVWGDRLILEFYRGKHRFIGKHFGLFPLLVHRLLLTGLLSLRLAAVLIRRLFSSKAGLKAETSFLLGGIAVQLGMARRKE